MFRSLLFAFLLLLCGTQSFAQKTDLEKFVEAWSVNDKTQTQKAEQTYLILKKEYNPEKFRSISKELDFYITPRSDHRLKARVLMFQVLGKREFSIKLDKQDTLKVAKAIRLARNLQDDQLLAEIYALAADIDFEGGYLLYNLKALELQKKIGFDYFSFVQNRFFGASIALYRTHDYQESINYGKKCLAFKNAKSQNWDPMVYIFQLDVIGASYIALQKYDNAIAYYKQIIDTVSSDSHSEQTKELWSGIAEGNIGRCLFYQGKTERALPLINRHLAAALKYEQWNNVALAENSRGEVFLANRSFLQAASSFRKALSASIRSDRLEEKVKSTGGLVESFAKLGNIDSVLFYQKQHNIYLSKQADVVNNGKLSAMNSKMLFDDGQRDLENANISISKLKQTRNFIIIGIAVFAVFLLLLYNRQALKNKLDKQKIVFEGLQAKAEVDKAKASLQQFKTQMVEKDQLIVNLRQSLQKSALENNLDEAQISKKLLDYVLATDEEWQKFKDDFNKVYPLFYPRIQSVLPNLSSAEERLASLIFLQMNNKEIASTLGIGIDSVARSKRRLKQKLPLLEAQTLENYILTLI